MTILKELCVAARRYTAIDGTEKTVWVRIGHLHESADGAKQYITLDRHINLAGFPAKDDRNGEPDGRVFVHMFRPSGEQAAASKPAAKSAPGDVAKNGFGDMTDDVPF